MTNKILIVAGVGDALCSSNSRKKIRDNETFVDKIETVIDSFKVKENANGVVNFHYPTDSFKDVDVFSKVKKTQLVNMRIHGKGFTIKDNELILNTHDDDETILVNGTEFSYIFRPQEYEVCLCGIDLHGIFANTIEELLEEGYTVKLFSDASNLLPATRKYISNLSRNKKFQFCSYKSA